MKAVRSVDHYTKLSANFRHLICYIITTISKINMSALKHILLENTFFGVHFQVLALGSQLFEYTIL